MDNIKVGIYDEHKLLQEGICGLIENVKGIEVVLKENNHKSLQKNPATKSVNILIVHLIALNTQILNMITQLNILYPRMKILIISSSNDERTILKTIKSGAKGFLAKDSDSNDLLEAIYTLRNGHDYYSKSITHLLLNKYISNLKNEDENTDQGNMKNLSLRELEILKLWGNSFSNKEIADTLFISVRTVESHKNHIMQKLNLKTAVDMVKFAIKNNIIEI
jgi:DNA-binding NarL/FixJ family response regulator